MAYGTVSTPGPGTALAFDIISGAYFGRYKVSYGGEGVATDVSDDNPLPVRDTVLEAALANMAPARTVPGQYTVLDTQRLPCDTVQSLPAVAGARFVLVQAEAQNIRYVLNGDTDTPVAANFGMILHTGQPPIILAPSDLTKIEFIAAAAGAFLNVTFCQ